VNPRTYPALARALAAGALSILPAPALSAQTDDCHDFAALDAALANLVATTSVDGLAASIARDGVLLFEAGYGTFTPDTVVPIASATKWLSATVILSLVDDGLLDLDAPIAIYLPSYQTVLAGTATVRQCFSHTAGMVGQHPAISSTSLTLQQAVDLLATVPLRTTPGTDFSYGGVSMHVAGRVAEVVSGQSWAQLFQDRVATPLGMANTDYLGLGSASNPRIAGGARSSLRDLGRFVAMLQNGGRAPDGTQVLSPASLDRMLRDQTGGVPITSAPASAPGLGYGIGCWIERVDASGRAVELSSPGAFGCTPWIDLERGTEGVLLPFDLLSRLDDTFDAARSIVRDELRFRGVECFGAGAGGCRGLPRAAADAAPRADEAAFALRCTNAPPSAPGLLLAAPTSASPPVDLFGVPFHVDPFAGLVYVDATTDALGSTSLPLPLVGVPIGTSFVVQYLFLETEVCAATNGFVASPGLAITVR
jgi:CubicO group peptidase (beta-lactamase class C family)